MSKNLILFDRSRTATDWTCERKRYLNYELDGTGIVPAKEALELAMGTILHDSLAAIATQHPDIDIDSIAFHAKDQMLDFLTKGLIGSPERDAKELYATEQANLIEGLLRGFYKHCWPRLINQYPKLLAIEQEMSYNYEGIIFMCKPDLVAATQEGEVVYIEYKSTSSKKEEWVNSWGTAIQLHATTRAIESALNEKISHVVVQGLYKGYESYGKQSSPFCYAYQRYGTPPFSKNEISYEYKAGYRRTPLWEMEGGVKAWVANMPEAILANQFPCTPPIFVNDSLVESFFAQRNIREREIDLALDMLEMPELDSEGKANILDAAFPQKWDACSPAWGRGCPYQRICHGSVPDPLKSGFVKRQAHHQIEASANASGS